MGACSPEAPESGACVVSAGGGGSQTPSGAPQPSCGSAVMTAGARSRSRKIAGPSSPARVTSLGKILYHPEAIMLAVTPADDLAPIRAATVMATKAVTGSIAFETPWTPHITLCYSTSEQPAHPVIPALRAQLPSCRGDIPHARIRTPHAHVRD